MVSPKESVVFAGSANESVDFGGFSSGKCCYCWFQLRKVLFLQSVSSEELDLFAELLIEDDDVKHDLTPSDTAESIAAQFLRDRSRLLLLKTFF
jgi:hypothetical protein